MATLEVQASGSPTLTLNNSQFLRIIRCYPLAESFPFRLVVSLSDFCFEFTPGGEHKFEVVRGAGIVLKAQREDIGALEQHAYTVENLVLKVEDGSAKLLFPTNIPIYVLTKIKEATGWSESRDVVAERIVRLKNEGLVEYAAAKALAEAEEERSRLAKEQAAQAERDRQEALRRQMLETRAQKIDPKAELEEERRKAREHMEAIQARAQAKLRERASAARQPGSSGRRKLKMSDKASSM